jgi:MurNAc alpha-1-phosphate uridylyltransferase
MDRMQCIILAGGLGTRLSPATDTIPKALIPVRGRPFADYQLAWLARQGVADVVYCIGYRGRQIVAHVGDGRAWGLAVRYVDEGNDLKGTAGALRLACDADLLADAFFVLYGDSYLPIEFAPVFRAFAAGGRPALMTVMRNENRWDRSNVIFTPPTIALYDKRPDAEALRRMTHIDYGLSVISRDLIATRIARREVADLADLFRDLSMAGELAGYEVTQRFYEVGSWEGIADFAHYLDQSGR